MAISSYLAQTVSLISKGPTYLFDNTSPSGAITLTGTWPAGYTGRLKIVTSSVTSHTDCAGVLTIGGTETVTFTAAGTKITTTALTANPTVSNSGLDCHLHIIVIDSGGNQIVTETTTSLIVRFAEKYNRVQDAAGTWTTTKSTICFTTSTAPKIGDIIRYNSTDYVISDILPRRNKPGTEVFRTLLF